MVEDNENDDGGGGKDVGFLTASTSTLYTHDLVSFGPISDSDSDSQYKAIVRPVVISQSLLSDKWK